MRGFPAFIGLANSTSALMLQATFRRWHLHPSGPCRYAACNSPNNPSFRPHHSSFTQQQEGTVALAARIETRHAIKTVHQLHHHKQAPDFCSEICRIPPRTMLTIWIVTPSFEELHGLDLFLPFSLRPIACQCEQTTTMTQIPPKFPASLTSHLFIPGYRRQTKSNTSYLLVPVRWITHHDTKLLMNHEVAYLKNKLSGCHGGCLPNSLGVR